MLSDITLSDLHVELAPGTDGLPFTPSLGQFSAGLSAEAFSKIVEAGIEMVKSRLPVDVQFVGSRLTNGGAEVTARVKRSVLKAEIRALLELSSPSANLIRIRFGDIAGPAWVPVGMVIEKAIERATARPGVTRAVDDPRAVDVDPVIILKALNLPLTLAQPGTWSVAPTPEAINVGYSSQGLGLGTGTLY